MAVTCALPVFYTTTEGQTRRIAERLAERLRAEGLDSRVLDLAAPDTHDIAWGAVRGAIVGASLHVRQHQAAAVRFIKTHAAALNAVPSAFFSVSLSAASSHPDETAAARRLAEECPRLAGWRPAFVETFAGRLAYTQYNFFVRFVMKRIARRQGASTDTSRDYEFTDWDAVDRLASRLADRVRRAAA